MKRNFLNYGPNEKKQNSVQISVSYNNGGINYFSGNSEQKGFWGYFTVCERTEFGSFRSFPTDSENFKMLLLPASRNSKLKIEKLIELVGTKEIADLVWEGKKLEVYNLINKLNLK